MRSVHRRGGGVPALRGVPTFHFQPLSRDTPSRTDWNRSAPTLPFPNVTPPSSQTLYQRRQFAPSSPFTLQLWLARQDAIHLHFSCGDCCSCSDLCGEFDTV